MFRASFVLLCLFYNPLNLSGGENSPGVKSVGGERETRHGQIQMPKQQTKEPRLLVYPT